jgi:SAM-dependent methyltransferase
VDPKLLNDIIQWDVRNWSKALEYWENRVQWNARKYDCLELGSWQGGLSTWLALKGNDVVCSDLGGIGDRAIPLIEKYGVGQSIRCQDVDATDIPYKDHFDIVIFKSILGGIGRNGRRDKQQRAIDEIHKALKPGGRLLFAENLTGAFIHSFFRKTFVSWGEEWRYITLSEMKAFLKEFSSVQLETTGILGTLGRTENQKRILSAMDQAILNGMTPSSWKYIVYGVAEK